MNSVGPGMRPASFEVDVQVDEGNIHVFAVRGELDLSTAPAFEQPLEGALTTQPAPTVLVDLAGCEFIDSTGIALIVRAWQRFEQSSDSGRLALCGATRQVKRVLEISGVGTSIPIYPDVSSALAGLADEAPAA